MLEDTIVFAATGISAVLLISVRVAFALVLVWGRNEGLKLKVYRGDRGDTGDREDR